MNVQPRYNVEISPVREVALRGSADLGFWRQRLQAENLAPTDVGGKAQLLVTAVDARFLGLRFRELSIAVFVGGSNADGNPDAVYLVHAFNSRRSFAFIERTFYHTPYDHGDVRLQTRLPAWLELRRRDASVMRAQMSAMTGTSRKLLRCREEGWQGPILLPSRATPARPKVFFARLVGHTHVYAYAADDVLTIEPVAEIPVLGWLVESEFAPLEWSIRENAVHARTKSVDRSTLQLLPAGQSP